MDQRKRHLLYFLTFWLALAGFLPIYINSSFLEEAFSKLQNPTEIMSAVFLLSAVISLFIPFFLPPLLRRIGNLKTSLLSITIIILASLGIIYSPHPFWLFPIFAIYFTALRTLWMSMDIFLKDLSHDNDGQARGFFLTAINSSLIVAVFLSGLILGPAKSYSHLYLASIAVFIPIIFIIIGVFKDFNDQDYISHDPFSALKEVWGRPDIRYIIFAQLLLQFFYAYMVIYTPLYLHQTIGFSFPIIGFISTIMLLPFVMIELPLGYIADKFIGEKELLIGGFVIISLSTIAISFISAPSIWLWAGILFITRIGASTIEIMTETYFFKKIREDEAHILSLSRLSSPVGQIIATGLAGLTTLFIPLQYVFGVMGVILFLGVVTSTLIHDTK